MIDGLEHASDLSVSCGCFKLVKFLIIYQSYMTKEQPRKVRFCCEFQGSPCDYDKYGLS